MRTPHRSYPRAVILSIALVVSGFVFVFITAFANDFRVTSIRVTNNDVRLTWDAPGGSNYVVQAAASLTAAGFSNVSPAISVPGTNLQSTGYTDVGGMLGSTSRFYRVRLFPPNLQIYPTNATIGITMTNRYKVLLVYLNDTTEDVTAAASVTSLNSVVADVVHVTNGFALVRGKSQGTVALRAVYQGMTNTVNLTVAQMIGMYTVPPISQIDNYVEGQSNSVKVMGIFANGRTNNITPSSNLEGAFGGNAIGTRVDYNVQAEVANSFALITGQSAAAGDVVFTAGTNRASNFHVNWCWFTSIDLLPRTEQITIGETIQFFVLGRMFNGTTIYATNVTVVNRFSSDFGKVDVDEVTLRATGVNRGNETIRVNVNNGPGDFCSGGLSDSLTLSVVCPGFDQVDQSFTSGLSTTTANTVYSVAVQESDRKHWLQPGGSALVSFWTSSAPGR